MEKTVAPQGSAMSPALEKRLLTLEARQENMVTHAETVGIHAGIFSLKEGQALIRADVSNLQTQMATRDDIRRLQAQMATRDDIRRLQAQMATKDDIRRLQAQIDALEGRIDRLEERVARLEEGQAVMQADIRKLQEGQVAIHADIGKLQEQLKAQTHMLQWMMGIGTLVLAAILSTFIVGG